MSENEEFRMFSQLQKRLAMETGRKPTCPYCGQTLGIGQVVIMRKVWLPTRKREQLVLTVFHSLCWLERDAQRKADDDYLRKRAYGRKREVSFKKLANILTTGK